MSALEEAKSIMESKDEPEFLAKTNDLMDRFSAYLATLGQQPMIGPERIMLRTFLMGWLRGRFDVHV